MKKKLIGNQEHLPEDNRHYLFYPSGIKKAVLVHILGDGDCPSCWEEKENHFTDGVKVYKRLTF